MAKEYIERDALMKLLEVEERYGYLDASDINSIPAADVVEVKRGRWEPRMQDDGYGEYLLYFCSECGAVSPNTTRNYCQNCGARMRGAEDE